MEDRALDPVLSALSRERFGDSSWFVTPPHAEGPSESLVSHPNTADSTWDDDEITVAARRQVLLEAWKNADP